MPPAGGSGRVAKSLSSRADGRRPAIKRKRDMVAELATGHDGYVGSIPPQQRNRGGNPQTAWLLNRHVRQEPQHAELGGRSDRAIQPLADRHGVRLFLRLQRLGHEQLASDVVREHPAGCDVIRPGVPPHHRSGRALDRLDARTIWSVSKCICNDGGQSSNRPVVQQPIRPKAEQPE